MALLLHERAMQTNDADLVRLTLLDSGAAPRLVEALIPTRPLEPGEQYRFHFDMTKCIGCRSCEVACNEQNGNPADIQWRRVGELEGGVYPDVMRTYLSMGCNHCLSADCLRGCPVDAYKKDPLTGIVLHSAEACIGCQYCVWNCPYSVPRFNPERGVVGKCDMCRDRLLDNREPACVSSCPENAIQIEIVNQLDWRRDYSQAESPGLPPAGQTISTTRITLPAKQPGSAILDRVDTGAIPLEHAHPSLVLMTTAMQGALGLLCALLWDRALGPAPLTLALVVTILAINVSVFHLGRPAYAWRALKMWRRSWLSREVLFFTLFLLALTACTAASWAPFVHVHLESLVTPLAVTTAILGTAGTLASARLYLVPARPSWNLIHTPIDFLLSALMLAWPLHVALAEPASRLDAMLAHHGIVVAPFVHHAHIEAEAIVIVAWILNQIVRLLRMRASAIFELRASYNHLRSQRLAWKCALTLLAALATLLFLRASLPWIALASAAAAVLLNRYLFFVSVVPRSMGLTFLRSTQHPSKAAA